ncbi:hypothetical protein JGZ98_02885 [Rummeliibacillus suwonensis]|nr:hypothetical protein [Rummeliibacillus suwonensis]
MLRLLVNVKIPIKGKIEIDGQMVPH